MNVAQIEKSLKNIDLEFDEAISQFMDECQCTCGFTLHAIDSRFLSLLQIPVGSCSQLIRITSQKVSLSRDSVCETIRNSIRDRGDLHKQFKIFNCVDLPDHAKHCTYITPDVGLKLIGYAFCIM